VTYNGNLAAELVFDLARLYRVWGMFMYYLGKLCYCSALVVKLFHHETQTLDSHDCNQGLY
jgi:hypothetical protein